MLFYGTGGAEGVPAPFCRCELCEYARKNGGRDRRMRSMLRISEELCIDLGPDVASAAALHGGLFCLEHVLVTHTHEDHFYYGLFETRALSKPAPERPLNVYLTNGAYDITQMYRGSPAFSGAKISRYEEQGVIAFHKLEFGNEYDIGNITVTPMRGNHSGNLKEPAANYLLGLPDGRKLFYAVDTGYFLPETLSALREMKIDIFVCECTYGGGARRAERPDFHLDFHSCIRLCRELLNNGTLKETSNVYLTHLNHKHGFTHADMERLARSAGLPCRVMVAWDGLEI